MNSFSFRSRCSWCSVFLAAVVFAGGSATAQTFPAFSTAIDIQQFKPAPGKNDILGIYGARITPHLEWRVNLIASYARSPLVFRDPETRARLQPLVGHQTTVDASATLGLWNRLELGVAVPGTVQRVTWPSDLAGAPPTGDPGGLGDVRIIPRLQLLEFSNIGASVILPVVLPSAMGEGFRGQGGIGFQPRLAVEVWTDSGLHLAVNGGVNFRRAEQVLDLVVSREVTYGGGFAWEYELGEHPGKLMATVQGSTRISRPTFGGNPLELLIANRLMLTDHLDATVGAGPGLSGGYGTPLFRVLVGLGWNSEGPRVRDSDGDGIPDDIDQCKAEPEDKDSFEDSDGCPDPDNDHDRVWDDQDQCPLVAGVMENKGCPDKDQDSDGLADRLDKCPDAAEDKDGFEDEDGCPDPDNDADKILDASDKCPLEPETYNDFDDDDGCPDEKKQPALAKVEGKKIVILEKVFFDTGKATIQERSFELLDQVATVLKANPHLKKVRVDGHSDSTGKAAFNRLLSQRRAEAVRQRLIDSGVAASRLEAEGFGPDKPISSNKTSAGRESNRRVEFTIVEEQP
jgi:large repetitive protein